MTKTHVKKPPFKGKLQKRNPKNGAFGIMILTFSIKSPTNAKIAVPDVTQKYAAVSGKQKHHDPANDFFLYFLQLCLDITPSVIEKNTKLSVISDLFLNN